jgi:hypothetical protein
MIYTLSDPYDFGNLFYSVRAHGAKWPPHNTVIWSKTGLHLGILSPFFWVSNTAIWYKTGNENGHFWCVFLGCNSYAASVRQPACRTLSYKCIQVSWVCLRVRAQQNGFSITPRCGVKRVYTLDSICVWGSQTLLYDIKLVTRIVGLTCVWMQLYADFIISIAARIKTGINFR